MECGWGKPAPVYLYSATKFALGVIESWRNEIQEFGETTILQPGVVDALLEVFSDGGEPVQFGQDLMLSSEEIGALTYQIVDTPPHGGERKYSETQ